MAKKFVRNITNTRCKGKNQEPLETNRQNDILSDEHDVYVRNKDYYHCLTNAIQKIESKNDSIIVSKKDKNTVELEYVGGDGGGGSPGTNIPTEIISKSKYIDVEEVDTNKFELSTGQLEIELKGYNKIIKDMEKRIEDLEFEMEGGFIGDIPGYEFEKVTDNEEVLNTETVLNSLNFDRYQYKYGIGKINIEVDSTVNQIDKTSIEVRQVRELKDTEPLKTFNIEYVFTNPSKKDLTLKFIYGFGNDPKILKPNGEVYKGDIIIPSQKVKSVNTTYYTDENGNIINIFIKE